MPNADVITEKVYCHDNPQNDLTTAMALASQNNGMWNNPFSYFIWMMFANRFMNNGEDCSRLTQNAEIMSKIDQLASIISGNQNTNLMMDRIDSNHEILHSIANTLGISFSQLQGFISQVQNAITQVEGQLGMTGQQIVNQVILGNKDLTAILQNCCCENKMLQMQNFSALQLQNCQNHGATISRIDQLANGITQGFSATSYERQRDKNEIIQAGHADTQRMIDFLNNHWSLEQSQALQDAKYEISQLKQNQYLLSQLKKCDCN